MTIEQPKEYDQEKKAIKEKYEKKVRKRFESLFISAIAALTLTLSFPIVGHIKSKNFGKNYPIHQIYTDNQNSLKYLKNKLNQHKSEKFPEFLSENIKNELEKIGIQTDFTKISSLEKILKIAEQDNVRIVNTSEFKEYSEKREGIKKNFENFTYLGSGFVYAAILGFIFLPKFYRKRGNKELTALDEKYGVIPEEP